MYLYAFSKFVKEGQNMNLKDFEGATYKVIIVCLWANKRGIPHSP